MNLKNIILIIIGIIIVSLVIYYFNGHNAFKGGDYEVNLSKTTISFKDGKFILNGKESGTYSSFYNNLTVHSDTAKGESTGHGIIGDTYITLDFPDYPRAWLIKKEPAAPKK